MSLTGVAGCRFSYVQITLVIGLFSALSPPPSPNTENFGKLLSINILKNFGEITDPLNNCILQHFHIKLDQILYFSNFLKFCWHLTISRQICLQLHWVDTCHLFMFINNLTGSSKEMVWSCSESSTCHTRLSYMCWFVGSNFSSLSLYWISIFSILK